MRKLFKYFKPFAAVLVLCIVLLFGQALCDLSLPNLMSNIVNIGIQQSGIEESTPKALSENGMQFVTAFMSEEDQTLFQSSYRLLQPGSDEAQDYVSDYPLLETQPVYVLSADDAAVSSTGNAYGRSILAFVNFIQEVAGQQGISIDQTATETGEQAYTTQQLYQLLPVLSQLPEETLSSSIAAAQEADPSLYSQMGNAFIRQFYTELGMDVNAIQTSYIVNTGLLMLLVTLLGVAAAVSISFFASRIAAGVARKLRHEVFTKVESFSSDEFDRFSTASLITRTTNDVTQVQMLIVMGIRMLCYAPIIGIGGIIMAVGKSVSLSWLIALAVIVIIGIIAIIFAIALPKFKSMQKLVDKLNLVARENLSGLMVIRAFGNQKTEEERFDRANQTLAKTNLFVNRVMVFLMPCMMFIMNLVTLVIVWVGGHQIAASAMQVGDMMAFMQYGMQIIFAFLMISMMFIMLPRASVSATRIAEVLETEPSIHEKPEGQRKTLGNNAQGKVEFRHVSFRYHDAESDMLDNISFTAYPGQTTAIIGSTGAGKSTLINLIPRFHDVTEGSILIDGIDIRDLSLHELRENIGYVPQKGVLFSGDIASNIRYGKQEATDAEIWDAAETAQATEFIQALDDKMETPISQGGTNVSGGQKQRLSIARALVKNAPIYIFDDSFSALDFKTDAALRRALRRKTGQSTVLIVAQRVSTIMNAEQIIVLDEGKIVGIGTHKELLQTCQEYREIAESQLSEEELA